MLSKRNKIKEETHAVLLQGNESQKQGARRERGEKNGHRLGDDGKRPRAVFQFSSGTTQLGIERDSSCRKQGRDGGGREVWATRGY